MRLVIRFDFNLCKTHWLTCLLQFEVNDLKKAHAQFELRLLNLPDSPEDAVRASRAAYDVLVVLLGEVEERRNGCEYRHIIVALQFSNFVEATPENKRPSVTPFGALTKKTTITPLSYTQTFYSRMYLTRRSHQYRRFLGVK
jgi:hypothetical protein